MLLPLLATLLSGPAHANEIGTSAPLGIGVVFGSPTGLTGKYYLGGRQQAIDFSLGTTYDGRFYDGVHVAAAYHMHLAELTSGNGVDVPFRVGVGGFVSTGNWGWGRYANSVFLGLKVPVGLDFDLEELPLQFFIEAVPVLAVYPGIWLGLDAGLGARYYF